MKPKLIVDVLAQSLFYSKTLPVQPLLTVTMQRWKVLISNLFLYINIVIQCAVWRNLIYSCDQIVAVKLSFSL